jgi:hypothetical protein
MPLSGCGRTITDSSHRYVFFSSQLCSEAPNIYHFIIQYTNIYLPSKNCRNASLTISPCFRPASLAYVEHCQLNRTSPINCPNPWRRSADTPRLAFHQLLPLEPREPWPYTQDSGASSRSNLRNSPVHQTSRSLRQSPWPNPASIG